MILGRSNAAKLRGVPISGSPPGPGDALVFDGSAYTPGNPARGGYMPTGHYWVDAYPPNVDGVRVFATFKAVMDYLNDNKPAGAYTIHLGKPAEGLGETINWTTTEELELCVQGCGDRPSLEYALNIATGSRLILGLESVTNAMVITDVDHNSTLRTTDCSNDGCSVDGLGELITHGGVNTFAAVSVRDALLLIHSASNETAYSFLPAGPVTQQCFLVQAGGFGSIDFNNQPVEFFSVGSSPFTSVNAGNIIPAYLPLEGGDPTTPQSFVTKGYFESLTPDRILRADAPAGTANGFSTFETFTEAFTYFNANSLASETWVINVCIGVQGTGETLTYTGGSNAALIIRGCGAISPTGGAISHLQHDWQIDSALTLIFDGLVADGDIASSVNNVRIKFTNDASGGQTITGVTSYIAEKSNIGASTIAFTTTTSNDFRVRNCDLNNLAVTFGSSGLALIQQIATLNPGNIDLDLNNKAVFCLVSSGCVPIDFANAGSATINYQETVGAAPTTEQSFTPAGAVVIPKTAGKGIRVDLAAPTFGWRDIIGFVQVRAAGANDPAFNVYSGGIRQYQFSNLGMNEIFWEFHLPHDYLPGSDLHIHAHWSQAVVDTGGPAGIPGDVKWQFEATYAKGHNQAPFISPVTTSVVQTASGVAFQHMLAEMQLSALSPSGTQLDTDDLEPDGLILVRAFRIPTDAADTLDQGPFLHFCDLHYQSTNIATKQKAPDFYV